MIPVPVGAPETPKCLGEKQAPSRTIRNRTIPPTERPRIPQGPILAVFWEQFWTPFGIIVLTISATTRFSKMCTAPTREHDFRGSSLPKITHVGTLFPLNFRTFSRPPSGTPFWSLLCRFGPQQLDFGTPSGSHWGPKRHPKGTKSTKKRAHQFITLRAARRPCLPIQLVTL